VNPEHDGKRLGYWPFGHNHVEEQAVFLAGLRVVAVPFAEIGLRARSAERVCIVDAGPGFLRNRLVPAKIADRRLRVGDAEKLSAVAYVRDPAKLPNLGADNERFGLL
jgi:hypothetical protein